jgi:HTH-type transcriptional regulator / antitoxin HigA
MATTTFSPAEVFPPGDFLREELDERGWTVTEFAEIIGRPVQAVSEILNGKKEITPETAIAFAEALGTSPELWLNLQTSFRLWIQRSARTGQSPVARRARLRTIIPLSEVRSRGWVNQTAALDELESDVCRLLEIENVTDAPAFALAARRSNGTAGLTIEQSAWIGRVRQIARGRSVKQFDVDGLSRLAASLPRQLRAGPVGLRSTPAMFAAVGVVLVFLQGLRGGKLDGAVTILEDGTPVIGITGRGDRFDIVLFTLLHECAHLTLAHIAPGAAAGSVWVDDEITGTKDDPIEIAANEQAAHWTFPDGFSVASTAVPGLVEAAARYGVHASIVIGRLQHERDDFRLHRTHIAKVRQYLPTEENEG